MLGKVRFVCGILFVFSMGCGGPMLWSDSTMEKGSYLRNIISHILQLLHTGEHRTTLQKESTCLSSGSRNGCRLLRA